MGPEVVVNNIVQLCIDQFLQLSSLPPYDLSDPGWGFFKAIFVPGVGLGDNLRYQYRKGLWGDHQTAMEEEFPSEWGYSVFKTVIQEENGFVSLPFYGLNVIFVIEQTL